MENSSCLLITFDDNKEIKFSFKDNEEMKSSVNIDIANGYIGIRQGKDEFIYNPRFIKSVHIMHES